MSLFSAEKKSGFHEAILFLRNSQPGTLVDLLESHPSLTGKAQFLIEFGSVYVNQLRQLESQTWIKPNALLRIHSEPRRYTPALNETHIFAETEDYIVINKPAHLPTHATVDNMVENAFSQLKKMRPSIYVLNRLDLETNGLLVFAKTKSFHREFQDILKNHQLLKLYRTIVEGFWQDKGLFEHEMTKSFKSPKIMTRLRQENTQTCQLEVLDSTHDPENQQSQLEIRLITGRPHQIRAQCAFEGHPLVGDQHYGSRHPYPFRLTCHTLRWTGQDGKVHDFRLNSTK